MGSFLMNCNVSNQVIPEEASVVIVPIFKQFGYSPVEVSRGEASKTALPEFNSFCYANCFWTPVGIKINAKADDYGKQKLLDSPFNRISLMTFFHFILTKTFTAKQGENEYHDLPFCSQTIIKKNGPGIFKALTQDKYFSINQAQIGKIKFSEFQKVWEILQESIRENRVFCSDHQGRPAQVQLSITLKDAYDYLIANSEESYISKTFARKMSNFTEELDRYKKFFKTSDPKSERFMGDFFKFETGESSDIDYYEYIRSVLDKAKPTEETAKKMRKTLSEIFDFAQFQSAMNQLNLKFTPMVGGSQDYWNESGLLYTKMVSAVAKMNKSFIKQKYDE